jgi:nanoRNase/pAp phosphatase (c-di-AMP/oligoRNAs hydrolase)
VSQKNPIKGETWVDNIDRAAALIGEKENFLFCGDIDPDSVCSMMSLALFLRLMDKQASIVLSTGLSHNLDYLISILNHNSIRILETENQIKSIEKSVEAIIVCDTANTKMVPFYSLLLEKFIAKGMPVIEIDHHFGADSEAITRQGIKLFREANATTEIIGELLQNLVKKFPETTDPFSQRNILIGLITGLLGDTAGGKTVPIKEDFDYWMKELGERLTDNTRWRKAREGRPSEGESSKFETPEKIRDYLDRLSIEQEGYLNAITSRIDKHNGLGLLNLMSSVYKQIDNVCGSQDFNWFPDILGPLLNRIPEEAGKLGMIFYNGKNAEEEACIFIKLRRAIDYDGFDLREVEGPIQKAFGDAYMGGGGHPGAVSFRVNSIDEADFLLQFKPVTDLIKDRME